MINNEKYRLAVASAAEKMSVDKIVVNIGDCHYYMKSGVEDEDMAMKIQIELDVLNKELEYRKLSYE